MSRRHGIQHRPTPDDLSSQQLWDDGQKQLTIALTKLLEDEAAVRNGNFKPTPERLEELEKLLVSAMYSFEILVERKANLQIVKPLAEGCRRLAEGLLNGDGDEVFEGRKLIVHTMLPIEEEKERRRQQHK